MLYGPDARTRLVAALIAAAALLTACAGPTVHLGAAAATSAAPTASATPPAPPALQVESPAPWSAPLRVGVTAGSLTDVVATDRASQAVLAGSVQPGGTEWVSSSRPVPGASYDVTAVVATATGTTHLTGSVAVTTQPDSAKMRFGILPGTGAVVGVNAPVVIRFAHPVSRKADVENALHVMSSTPVVGAWHWISSSELHFRPETAWPAHTKVRVTAALEGLQMSSTRYGSRSVTVDFAIGDAHLTTVDDKAKTLTVTVNGAVKYTWPTSLGRPEYVTRTGDYIVLEKLPIREMTSCTAKITCDKKSPDYYDLQVQWATRLSWSGTFIHAAPWDAAKQGLVDSSHGCIHLTIDRAKTYFDLAQYGDLVTVKNTGRPIGDLIAHGDPGASDWNTDWTAWVDGSALQSTVTTDAIPA